MVELLRALTYAGMQLLQLFSLAADEEPLLLKLPRQLHKVMLTSHCRRSMLGKLAEREANTVETYSLTSISQFSIPLLRNYYYRSYTQRSKALYKPFNDSGQEKSTKLMANI